MFRCRLIFVKCWRRTYSHMGIIYSLDFGCVWVRGGGRDGVKNETSRRRSIHIDSIPGMVRSKVV